MKRIGSSTLKLRTSPSTQTSPLAGVSYDFAL